MSNATDHTARNRAATRQSLEREIAHNREEAARKRQEAVRLLGEARLLELEADGFNHQLGEIAA